MKYTNAEKTCVQHENTSYTKGGHGWDEIVQPAIDADAVEPWKTDAELLEMKKEEYTAAIKVQLNAKAREKGYDSYHTAMLYKGSKNAKFNAEAAAFFELADDTWTYVMDEGVKVENGEAFPSLDDFLANAPKLEDYLA